LLVEPAAAAVLLVGLAEVSSAAATEVQVLLLVMLAVAVE
jgi:hypothetical protein